MGPGNSDIDNITFIYSTVSVPVRKMMRRRVFMLEWDAAAVAAAVAVAVVAAVAVAVAVVAAVAAAVAAAADFLPAFS